jgi:deoxynucleotide monophosphate kinase-like protein
MVIGFTGRKGAGKDTAAQYFVDKYEFTKVAYADVLKEAAGALMNVPTEFMDEYKNNSRARVKFVVHHDAIRDAYDHFTDMSLRTFLQRFGTEMGREVFGSSFWVDQLKRRLDEGTMRDNYVISDVRFNNEVTLCDYIIDVVRDGTGPDGHVSEAGLDEELIHFIVVNNSTVEELHKRLEACFTEMLSARQQANI